MSNKLIILVVFILIGMPLLIIGSLNVLGANIDYSFGSWLAVLFLAFVIQLLVTKK